MGNPLTDDVYVMKTSKTVSLDDGISWEQAECPHCGTAPMFVVATALDGNINIAPTQRTRWLRCPRCLRGSVVDRGTLYPPAQPLRNPADLPPREAATWSEVRRCLGAGAYLAASALCLTTIRRLAAREGTGEEMSSDAESLPAAVERLVAAGYLTAKMRTWSDRLVPTAESTAAGAVVDDVAARDLAAFTLRVLESVAELDALDQPPAE